MPAALFGNTDQSYTPSLPIGLIETKSDFKVRSAETSLGR